MRDLMQMRETGSRMDAGAMLASMPRAGALVERDRERQMAAPLPGLVGNMLGKFEEARRVRQPREYKMLEWLRRREARYDDQTLARIAADQGSKVYVPYIDGKSTAAESWIRSIYLGDGRLPWDIRPTAMPMLPPQGRALAEARYVAEVQAFVQRVGEPATPVQRAQLEEVAREQARKEIVAEAMKGAEREKHAMRKILKDGGLPRAFSAFVTDLCTLDGAGMRIGFARRPMLLWGDDGRAEVREVPLMEFHRVSPFDVYFQPGVEDVQEGWFFIRYELTADQLGSLAGVPGYNADAIRAVLAQHEQVNHWRDLGLETARGELERKGHEDYERLKGRFEALEYWGPLTGRELAEAGYRGRVEPWKVYEATAWIVGSSIVKAVLNPHPTGKKPLFWTSWRKAAGALYGKSLPEVLAHIEDGITGVWRHMLNNVALASGPQVVIDMEKLAPNYVASQIFPWKQWYVSGDQFTQGSRAMSPIQFHQPDSNAPALMAVIAGLEETGDRVSGVPAYLGGDPNVGKGGATSTASGFGMMQGNAGKGIQQVSLHIDMDVLQPMIELVHEYMLMMGHPDAMQGDVEIRAQGLGALQRQERDQVRLNELLNVVANPVLAPILGPHRLLAILRGAFRDVGVEFEDEDMIPGATAARIGYGMPPPPQAQPELERGPAGPPGQAGTPGSAPAAGPPVMGDGAVAGGQSQQRLAVAA